MAPAAADTLLRYFSESGESPSAYDRIVTGDLGQEGLSLLCRLTAASGLRIDDYADDCGIRIYDRDRQDAHAGGSGCGCSATVLAAHWMPRLASGALRRILLVGTGAMMSPASLQQGLEIPAIGHLLCLEHAT
jgi:stage V sporulation protein AD